MLRPFLIAGLAVHAPAFAESRFEFRDGDRVALLGDAFIEREQYEGWIELAATTAFPDRTVTFRNLGWSADTPAGASRAGLSPLQAGMEPPDEGWKQLELQLETYKPNVLITGYGMEGEDADRPGFDIAAFWARSGIASLLQAPDGPLPFQRGGMGDHTTGSSASAAVCAALFNRERTGKGQLVSTSLLRQGVYTISFDLAITLGWGDHIGIGRREEMGNPAMNNYTAADGRSFWLVGQEISRHWPPLCRVVGHPEWIEDERFATPMGRRTNAAELIGLLDAIFATKTFDEWAVILDSEPELFWAPVNTIDDVLIDAQAHAAGAFIEVPERDGGVMRVASPSDFYGTPWTARSAAPQLGEHTREVLEGLGLDATQIDAMFERGVVA